MHSSEIMSPSYHSSPQCVYLKTFPSAHSYFFPLTSTGFSHDHMLSTNSLSLELFGSSFVKS